MIALHLLREMDKLGNVDVLVTVVLRHMTLWQVLCEVPVFHSLQLAWEHMACKMNVNDLYSGYVFLEVTQAVRK